MAKGIFIVLLIFLASCSTENSIINSHVEINLSLYQDSTGIKASAMPDLRPESPLLKFKRRFEYLLINVSEIHLPGNADKRKEIWALHPDSIELKRLYLEEFSSDKALTNYFEATYQAIKNQEPESLLTYNQDELMEVASKFFYANKVLPDSTIQSYVCVGLNGLSEASWERDYTLLEAFCFEAIFNDLEKDGSVIMESYSANKQAVFNRNKPHLKTLDNFLLDVRRELFSLMEQDKVLKEKLLNYYQENKSNLAFKISTVN